MKRFTLPALLFPCLAVAGPANIPLGPNLTYGDVSINHNLMANVTNPAFGATMIKPGDNDYRIGILNLGGFFELGILEDIADKADKAATDLGEINTPTAATTPTGFTITDGTIGGAPVSINIDTIIIDSLAGMAADGFGITSNPTTFENELENRIQSETQKQLNNETAKLAQTMIDDISTSIDPVVEDLNAEGYAKGGIAGYVPLTPFVVSHGALGGGLEVNANFTMQGNGSYLSSYIKPSAKTDITLIAGGGAVTEATNWSVSDISPEYDIVTDAAVVLKIAAIQEVGVGYSRNVYSHENGKVYVGGQLNLYQVGLAKSYEALKDNSNTTTASFSTDLKNAIRNTDTGVGMDLGALWVADNYRLGATINNINVPSFKYTNITPCSNFSNYVDANDATQNVTSATLADCSSDNTYAMDAQLKLEAVASAWNDKVTFGFGYDANAVEDPFGQQYQWLTLGAGVNIGNWAGVRAGYRANQAADGLSFITLGFTLLNFNLDLGAANETVVSNGTSTPRSMYGSLSWGLAF